MATSRTVQGNDGFRKSRRVPGHTHIRALGGVERKRSPKVFPPTWTPLRWASCRWSLPRARVKVLVGHARRGSDLPPTATGDSRRLDRDVKPTLGGGHQRGRVRDRLKQTRRIGDLLG